MLLLNTKCPPWYLNHITLYLCLTKHSKGLINISSMKGVKFVLKIEGEKGLQTQSSKFEIENLDQRGYINLRYMI